MPVLGGGKEHIRQSHLAAQSSRLDPHNLHILEFQHFKGRLDTSQIPLYLTIRNSILRLWTRNPLVAVSRDEVVQGVTNKQIYGLAIFAHEWLARHAYINFGCVDITKSRFASSPNGSKQKTIVILGAGVSGLGCARQLHGIFTQFPEKWTKLRKEKLPRVILLEARHRVGGRVYSHPLKSQVKGSLPHGLANVAEMGAQIITGFDHGNPLDALVRGQLALEHHTMRDNMILYDHDGTPVDRASDMKMQALFNDLLEKASVHGWRHTAMPASNGVKLLDVQIPKFQLDEPAPFTNGFDFAEQKFDSVFGDFPVLHSTPLPPLTLGSFMDYIVGFRSKTNAMTSQDMRVLNWHYANLEYANAVNVDQLSLGGWDQDQGNEFEGWHSEIIGGYSQVPRALWQRPTSLDVRFGKRVTDIKYHSTTDTSNPGSSQVMCDDGEIFEADYVLSTFPLGVLREGSIRFNPQLPEWKTDAMGRLGFGVLNKVILVFDKIFWAEHRDMFGFLNLPSKSSTVAAEDYAQNRGRFYLFWNCVKTSGRPVLVALMAGNAAVNAEQCTDRQLIDEVMSNLAKMFSLPKEVQPIEALVTRWRKDPFARGSYSYMGPNARPGDYDAMAAPIGNLFFAGEATCGTHPATVHGAYLSGLRAAAEIVETMIGPVPLPPGFA